MVVAIAIILINFVPVVHKIIVSVEHNCTMLNIAMVVAIAIMLINFVPVEHKIIVPVEHKCNMLNIIAPVEHKTINPYK